MRFVLRKGGQSFLVFSRDRFLELDTLERAVDFLTDYLLSPDNLRALRRAILDDAVRIHLLGLDLSELIEHVGRLMFDGELRFLLNPRDMTPWRWAFPHTPSFPSEESEGKAEAKSLTGEADKGEDKEPEYEDIKPEPVVPPEFPRMAKREADAIDLAAKVMGFMLDILRFVGEKALPESLVASQFPDMASSQGQALDEAVGDAGSQLAGLAAMTDVRAPESQVAATLPDLAKGAKVALTDQAGSAGDVLADLLSGPPTDPQPSNVGPELRNMAGSHSNALDEQTKEVAAALAVLNAPPGDGPRPSEVPGVLRNEAAATGKAINNAAVEAGEVVAKMGEGPEAEPPTPSVVGATFKDEAGSQGGELVKAVVGAALLLAVLGRDDEPEQPPGAGDVGVSVLRNAAEQGQVLDNAAGVIGDTLDPLSGKAKPAADKGIDPSGKKPDPLDPGPHWARFQLIDHENGKPYAKVRLKLKIGDDLRTVTTDGKGMVEIRDLPANLFDVQGMLSPEAFEVVEVIETVEQEDKPEPTPPKKTEKPTTETSTTPAPAPSKPERPLLPEEDAWLKDVNRVRKARGLPLKTRADIPAEITSRAQERAKARAEADERRREPEKLKAEEQARQKAKAEAKAANNPKASPKERPLLPEEQAWLRDINRVRGREACR